MKFIIAQVGAGRRYAMPVISQKGGIAAWHVFSKFHYACKRGWSSVIRESLWWSQALAGIPYCLEKRHPVSWKSYKQWLRLPETR